MIIPKIKPDYQIKVIESKTMKKISNSITIQLLILGVLATTFFYEVFRMQFWKDDYSLLYCQQQKITTPFPYHHGVDFYKPLFLAFGTKPLGYFVVGLLFLFLSSVAFYFFVYKLFSKKTVAFLSSVIFLTSPVGIDTIFMATTFAFSYFIITLFLIALILLIKFYQEKKFCYYFFALLILALSFELVPFRAFFFVGIILLFEFLNLKKEKKAIRSFLLRQILLFSIWIFFIFIKPIFLLPEALKYDPQGIGKTFQGIINYQLLLNPLLTCVNIIFAGFAYLLYRKFYFVPKWLHLTILFASLLFFLYLFLKFRKKEKHLTKIYLFSLGYLFLIPFSFYPYSTREISHASFRYMTNALPAYSLLVIPVYRFLTKILEKKKRFKDWPLFLLGLILLINALTTHTFIADFNTRSPYSTRIFTQLKQFIPKLKKGSFIYFQLDKDANVNYRLIDTYRIGQYGPEVYFAVLYNLKQEDIKLVTTDFAKLTIVMEKDPQAIDKIVAFRYDKDGLHPITDEIRKSVREKINTSNEPQ